jgi:hypothetical protein
LYSDDHFGGRLCIDEVQQLGETGSSSLSLGSWELRCCVRTLRYCSILVHRLMCELARKDGETVSLYELLCCEDHHQEVHVFSHLNCLLRELEHILDPEVVLVAAYMAAAQQGNMAEGDIVQVEGTGTIVLDHWQVLEVGRGHRIVVWVVLGPRRLVHTQQRPAQRWFGRRQDGRDNLD